MRLHESVELPRERHGATRRAWAKTARGFTVLETLAVLVLIGVATSIGVSGWNNARNNMAAEAFANQIRSRIQTARFEAIKRNRNVAVFFDTDTQTIRTVAKDASNEGCDIDAGDVELSSSSVDLPDTAELADSVTLQGTFVTQGGIVWRSNGLTGSCWNFTASGFNTLQVRFAEGVNGVTDFDIDISSAGRVQVSDV